MLKPSSKLFPFLNKLYRSFLMFCLSSDICCAAYLYVSNLLFFVRVLFLIDTTVSLVDRQFVVYKP